MSWDLQIYDKAHFRERTKLDHVCQTCIYTPTKRHGGNIEFQFVMLSCENGFKFRLILCKNLLRKMLFMNNCQFKILGFAKEGLENGRSISLDTFFEVYTKGVYVYEISLVWGFLRAKTDCEAETNFLTIDQHYSQE